MKRFVHTLGGCAPAPLAFYLKALGVLRIVSEQADSDARGFWKDDQFRLVTKLDVPELLAFFLERYAPTPLLSPWNGGSGFYPKGKNNPGIDGLVRSSAQRFAGYRQAIEAARVIVGDRREQPKEEEKAEMLRALRAALPEAPLDWLDAAVVLTGKDTAQYPALLGSGGNDGNLEFTNNQMQRLVELFDMATGAPFSDTPALLSASLFGTPSPGLKRYAIGQFLPGNAGGPNAVAGFDAESLINPWDFVLMLEGALLFQVAAVRRLEGYGLPEAAAPFAVRTQSIGYASAAVEKARGEQWMPLWGGPSVLAEVRSLFAEGRLQTGKDSAETALDAALAIARLGSARGVTSFSRFGYLERNGRSNFAVPLGRFTVAQQPHIELLDEIMPWMRSMQSYASRAKNPPAAFLAALRNIQECILATSRKDAPRVSWAALLLALVSAEDMLVRRPKATAEYHLRPIPPLSAGWVRAIDDGSPEVRIALAIASQVGPRRGFDPIRANCLPLDRDKGYSQFATSTESLRKDAGVVWTGRQLVTDLGLVLSRRVVEAQQSGLRIFPLQGRAFAGLDDIGAFLEGRLDEPRIAGLARGFMALSDAAWSSVPKPPPAHELSVLHALFRVSYLAMPLDGLSPRCDPSPVRLLLAGRLQEAAVAALRGLIAQGRKPKLRHIAGSADLARRLAASLVIPVAPWDLRRLLDLLAKPFEVSSRPMEGSKT